MTSNAVAIVQARMGSGRLPGKVLADIAGRAMVDWVLTRTQAAKTIDQVWLATSDNPENDRLAAHVEALGFRVFRGDEDDVLARFADAAAAANADIVVRITADCPLIDPGVIDRVVDAFRTGTADFVSNTLRRSYPDGLDVEVFSRGSLDRANTEAGDALLRLHVTPWMTGVFGDAYPAGGLTTAQVTHDIDFSHLRWCVDYADDLAFVRHVVSSLPADFGWQDIIRLLTRRPELARINRIHGEWDGVERDRARLRNVGGAARFESSNAAFDRAAKVIPLASQTFSKSHQQYVKGAAPLFMDRGFGCEVWDIDGNRYIDHVLGLLPVVLGYRDPDVDAAIQGQLERGITFSMPSTLECELAERLVALVPCAEMVRFGKNGSDATSAAVRLARAHTGRDRIAVCGYHGWHDWYIGTTTRDRGVPAAVKALSAKFPFNDADALAALLAADPDGYAAVILEPHGLFGPAPGFLERVRALTESHGTLLIFDEIVSGFRCHMGGAQALHGVVPDLASFGKAMANGMPISAVVGRAEIMAGMEEIFFSATFGGEALSLAAAIAAVDKMAATDLPAQITAHGAGLRDDANRLLARYGLAEACAFDGAGWWPLLKIDAPPVAQDLFVSLMRQAFAAEGLLLAGSFNLCLAHIDERIRGETLAMLDGSFAELRAALDAPDPAACLRGDMVKPTFQVRSSA